MITPIVILLCVVSSVSVKAPYPGLTQPEARCPESPSDPDFWYLSSFYQNIPQCFGRYPLPANLNEPADLIEVCRKKHKDAVPASLHSYNEVIRLNKFKLDKNALIGLYIPSNASVTEASLLNMDETPVDFKPVSFSSVESGSNIVYINDKVLKLTKLSAFTKDFQNKYVICMTYGYPRVLESYNRKPEPTPDLTQYECDGYGWKLAAPCGGTPFCYQAIENYGEDNIYQIQLAELNWCGLLYLRSFVATPHCEAEQSYLEGLSPCSKRGCPYTGYYIPRNSVWNKYDSWKATDGKPVNFIKWAELEPDNFNFNKYGNELATALVPGGGIRDENTAAWKKNDFHCKKLAVKKHLPLVKTYKTFEKDGKKCRKESATHWNHRCPTNSDLWRIVESDVGVHCYSLVPVPMPLTSRDFTHNICKQLHSHAKLASFHNDAQLSIINDPRKTFHNIIVGVTHEYDEFNWLDGTPMNTSFWAPSQPLNVTNDSVALIQRTEVASPCTHVPCLADKYYRPLFVMESMSKVTSNMRVACKVEAEPLLPCTPVPKVDKLKALYYARCPEGWSKVHLCDKVSCYKAYNIEKGNTFETIFERDQDYCNRMFNGSRIASVHCTEEHFYVQTHVPKTVIGLHIPKNLQNERNFKNFRWTDGTPVDFVGWNRYSNLINEDNLMEPLFSNTSVSSSFKPGYHAYNKVDYNSSGWTNIDYGFDGNTVLCKMNRFPGGEESGKKGVRGDQRVVVEVICAYDGGKIVGTLYISYNYEENFEEMFHGELPGMKNPVFRVKDDYAEEIKSYPFPQSINYFMALLDIVQPQTGKFLPAGIKVFGINETATVHQDYQRDGITAMLFKLSEQTFKDRGVHHIGTYAIASGTQKLCQRQGHELIYSLQYSDFKENGKPVYYDLIDGATRCDAFVLTLK